MLFKDAFISTIYSDNLVTTQVVNSLVNYPNFRLPGGLPDNGLLIFVFFLYDNKNQLLSE